MSIIIQKETHQLLDNQHLIENHQHLIKNHQHLITIKQNHQNNNQICYSNFLPFYNFWVYFQLIFISLMSIRKGRQKKRMWH